MTRVLIVPAAGKGSRLGRDQPKLLVPVAGRAMIDHVLDRYRDTADHVMVVVSPAARDQVRAHLAGRKRLTVLVQEEPTGMLDAILVPRDQVAKRLPDEVWVTWCDQVAVGAGTVYRLEQAMVTEPRPAFAFPTVTVAAPYIHFARDSAGRIVRVLHRREGDPMPADGESDIGLFAMTGSTYLEHLSGFADSAERSAGTGERNFLPFIPWLARRHLVRTISATRPIEAVGINTPDDLARVEQYLASDPDHA